MTQEINDSLPALKLRYIVFIYQDDFGNWCSSIKDKQTNETIKTEVKFYLIDLFKSVWVSLRGLQYHV